MPKNARCIFYDAIAETTIDPLNDFFIMQTFIQSIAAHCGIDVTRCEAVTGGDINECYCLHSNEGRYFLKLNDAKRFPHMFAMEAAGLDALRNQAAMVVPEVIKQGIQNNMQWLLLQWIEKGSTNKNTLRDFGTALARLHRQPQPYFGWNSNNYIGSLPQINTAHSSWTEFYTQCRILPLVKKLVDTHVFSKTDMNNATAFCKKLDGLFPEEAPALLHGDLWGGNYMINTNGQAAIFDPAVYYGHREMDLGMTQLFGGFSQPFYDAYHETCPLEKNWQQRLPLTQLYPLLVHAVLFGGHYVMNVKTIIQKLY